jgi:4-hydroxy-3-polyprenylbenzoate decarboxylase
LDRFCQSFTPADPICRFPLVVLVDDSDFTARNLGNFLWVTFTRSNPAADVYGVDSFTHHKHWGCRGPLVIDAAKPHHAAHRGRPGGHARVDALGTAGSPLAGII